jgi:hypothetical protein
LHHKVGESLAQGTICVAKEDGKKKISQCTNQATCWTPIKGFDSVHSLLKNEK